jgi:hypothetical protein
MPRGANGISTCTIRTVTSYRLRIRFDELPKIKNAGAPFSSVYLALAAPGWLVFESTSSGTGYVRRTRF